MRIVKVNGIRVKVYGEPARGSSWKKPAIGSSSTAGAKYLFNLCNSAQVEKIQKEKGQ
jgi:hypothetical protein